MKRQHDPTSLSTLRACLLIALESADEESRLLTA